jgi:hypothetical protein
MLDNIEFGLDLHRYIFQKEWARFWQAHQFGSALAKRLLLNLNIARGNKNGLDNL